MPQKLIEGTRRIVETIGIQVPFRLLHRFSQTRTNPAIREGQVRPGRFSRGGREILQVHEGKTSGIPDFVDEELISRNALFRHPHIAPLSGKGRQSIAKGIGSVFFYHFQGIDTVSPRFAHLFAPFITHKGMKVYIPEGNILHHIEPHHHHPGNPEEQDIEPRNEERGRIKRLQCRGVFRPAEGGKGPQGGAKPRVEDIFVLVNGGTPAMGTMVGIMGAYRFSPQASQYQTGIRCPHQIWREIHQSRMLFIHS